MLRNAFTSACAVALLASGAVGTAAAQQDASRPVYFTFSQPVALPRVTLPAGRYLFKLVNSGSTRSVVQVSSADGAHQFGMFMTMPIQRNERPNDPEVRFLETAANTPAAIGTYWYPGMSTGWEFIYPRDEATRLAQSSKRSVLTTAQAGNGAADAQNAPLVRITPTGEQAATSDQASQIAVTGTATRGEFGTAPAAPSASAASTSAPRSSTVSAARSGSTEQASIDQSRSTRAARTRLPQTSSAMPMVMLVGALCLAVALLLSVSRRLGA
ncbi:MAG: hypothetical protein ABI051_16440 [Vicinamibacterales bacterium]